MGVKQQTDAPPHAGIGAGIEAGIEAELTRVGGILAARRDEIGASIDDISTALRILPEYIDAIETGDLHRLPAPAYFIGYVRTYANHLGLPAAELCQALHQACAAHELRPTFHLINSKAFSPSGSGRVALAAVLAAGVLYAGWYLIDTGLIGGADGGPGGDIATGDVASAPSNIEEALGAGEPIYQPVIPYTENPNTPPAESAPTENAPTETASVESIPAENTLPETAPIESAQAETALTENTTSDITPEITPAEILAQETPPPPAIVSATPAITPATTALAHSRDPANEMVITAMDASWIELTRPDGSQIAAWLMRKGEVYAVSGDEAIYLTTGNAGGLSIAFGAGQTVILGAKGEVIRAMPLDARLIDEANQ